MNEKDMLYFRIIGKIHEKIASSTTFDDAVSASLKIILENSVADYAVIWQATDTGNPILLPSYWICPIDLSNKKYNFGDGIVGKVFKSHSIETIFDFKSNPDERIKSDFEGINISSVICLPLETNKYNFGCIEFIKANGEIFTNDDLDVCSLLTAMAQIELEAEAPLKNYKPKEEVLMTVRNIKKSFKNGDITTQVLKGINFDVYKGEFLCLLGESGCGKSTMLNVLGGLLNFDDGNLTFNGESLNNLSEKELTKYRRENIGFIFQSYNLMPNLNAKQNLDLIGELVKNPENSMELLKKVGLEDKANNYPSELSGGQQQRIAIARAMIKKPKLILADEPTAALDYTTSIEVLSVMEKLVNNGTSLILITHNEEITKMADRVIRLRDGKTYEIKINRHPLHATELIW